MRKAALQISLIAADSQTVFHWIGRVHSEGRCCKESNIMDESKSEGRRNKIIFKICECCNEMDEEMDYTKSTVA